MVVEIPVTDGHSPQVDVIRNRANRFLGVALPIALLGLLVVSDPLRLWLEAAPDERVVDFSSVVFVGVLAAAVGSVTFGWYPSVKVAADRIEVRNPVYTYRFAPASIEFVDTWFQRYPRILVGGRRIPVVGAEHSLRMSILQRHSLSQRLEALPDGDGTATTVGEVVVSRRRITAWEGVVWSVWGLALLIVVARAALNV